MKHKFGWSEHKSQESQNQSPQKKSIQQKLLTYFFHKKYHCDDKGCSVAQWSIEKTSTILLLVALPFIIEALICLNSQIDMSRINEVTCPFRLEHNLYCPACGGTRAVALMLHGDLVRSLYYNPFVVVSTIEYLFYLITNLLHYLPIKNNHIRGARYHIWYLLVPIGVLVLNFAVKNVLLLCFQIEMIP